MSTMIIPSENELCSKKSISAQLAFFFFKAMISICTEKEDWKTVYLCGATGNNEKQMWLYFSDVSN